MFDLPISWADAVLGPMFHLELTVLEKALRPIIVYLFLVVLLRVFGKRELAQLNPFDLVVLLSLANTLQNAIIGDDTSVTGGLIGAFTLCAFNYLVVRFLFRHRKLDQWVEGRATQLIRDGKPCRKAMARELITDAELRMMIHRQGYRAIGEVKSCTIEPGGSIVVEGKTPATADRNHAEILARLDELSRQVEDLKGRLESRERGSP